MSQADATIQEKEELLDTLEGDAARMRQEMEKTYRAYQNDQISVEGFGHLYRPLEERLKQLGAQPKRARVAVPAGDRSVPQLPTLDRRWLDR